MATRKIKDAKDLSTNELIYFKGHAKATYMSDGTTVEEAINNINVDGGSIDLTNYVTKTEFESAERKNNDIFSSLSDTLADIETIRSNAANYKGTVTSVKINGSSKSPSNGVVDLGYIHKQLSTSTSSSMTIMPNKYHRNTNTSLSSLTITLGSVTNSNIINEYFVEFTTRSSGTTVSLPSTIKWANGTAPTFEAGCTYQVSIVNNLGTYIKFA